MDGWMDGWVDGWTLSHTDGRVHMVILPHGKKKMVIL